MLKHIIGQSVFQLIVMMILIFAGERIIPEYFDANDTGVFAGHPEYKWSPEGEYVRSGRFYHVNGDQDY